jgi:hypothetical protein
MSNKIIFWIGSFISFIIFLLGILMFLSEISYIKYASIFGNSRLYYNEAMEHNGNMSIIGIILIISSIIAFIITYLISNNKKMVENSEKQIKLLNSLNQQNLNPDQFSNLDNNDIAKKLKQISDLYKQELITEEEYELKRKEIINKL